MSTAIRVGSIAVAKVTTGVCDVDEIGVCYEVYRIGIRPRYSFIFEKGRYDGFSPDEVEMMLTLSGDVCEDVAGYEFKHVGQLRDDYRQGRFAPAFRQGKENKS
jgi:hypothetical protein